VRDSWQNLNGEWQFDFDHGQSGRERNLPLAESLDKKIIVPFCPESSLSGVKYTDFIRAVWYRRTFVLPAEWAGKRILLHFGAVDYDSEVWVNGCSVGTHRGGYTSFTYEITGQVKEGENVLAVCAEDDVRSRLQASGKQSTRFHSYECLYTRTTGIWQTVWLEAVPDTYLSKLRLTPDLENGCINLVATIDGPAEGMELTAEASLDGIVVGKAQVRVAAGLAQATVTIAPEKVQAWAPGNPVLYDLRLALHSRGKLVDSVTSYFGLRSLGIRGPALLLNGRPIFHRLLLDQGFFPDGIYTAPSDSELRGDIERGMAMGFNGARLHQKVCEQRLLYWADKLGYLVWGEMADWGIDLGDPAAGMRFISEWLEVLERDYNHPSIVGWCPFNETWGRPFPELLRLIYRITKQFDPTRPAIDTSGNFHIGTTDVYDAHDYDQNPSTLAERLEIFTTTGTPHVYWPGRDAPFAGQPYFISEYGGIWWSLDPKDVSGWGYGERPKTEEEFLTRYRALTEVLLNHPRIAGFGYTQLTDVEQEQNGLYTYQRVPKFDPAIIHAITSQPAAIERDK
jgi:beta-galactosidase/beta-glucuronidase